MHCPGRSFPIQTLYRPLSAGRGWEEGFADGLAKVFDTCEGDILAFVPGAGEIRRVAGRLGGLLSGRAEVLGLHGLLPLSEQRRIAARGSSGAGAGAGAGAQDSGLRRVIVSTSIAETSLTVPGVRAVCDSGWSRLSRFHPATGLDRLVTERVSMSSAAQRQGRAGRLGPGLCVRFWSESEKIPMRSDPEILRSDLCGLVLECALWGAREPGALAWMDPPPASAWTQAWEILRMLELVSDGGPTDLGRTVAGFGLPPRLGVLFARGAQRGSPVLAAACAALLEERDSSGITGDPDLRLRLELLRTVEAQGGRLDSWRRSVMTETDRILRRTGIRSAAMSWTAEEEAQVGNLLSYGFPDRIARRAPDKSYNFVTGRMARLPGLGVSRAAAPWICAPDADAGETTA